MSQAALTIAVLEGGATGERDVSLETGKAVRAALAEAGHAVRSVQIEADGLSWSTGETRGAALEVLAKALGDIDVFFLALHGGAGEGGPLQGLFESLGRCFTGSGSSASALCLDKLASLCLFETEGLRPAARRIVRTGELPARLDELLAFGARSSGLVIKPRHGGSSVMTSVLAGSALEPEPLEAAIAQVLASPDEALVEALIPGVEVTCGVLEDERGQPQALPVVEIRTKDGRFFDYEEKYSESGALELCPAESLTESELEQVRGAALAAHRLGGCSGYSRSDFILAGEPTRVPIFLEINTLPGMTPRSLLPQAARAAGLDFPQLCERIVRSGLARGAH